MPVYAPWSRTANGCNHGPAALTLLLLLGLLAACQRTDEIAQYRAALQSLWRGTPQVALRQADAGVARTSHTVAQGLQWRLLQAEALLAMDQTQRAAQVLAKLPQPLPDSTLEVRRLSAAGKLADKRGRLAEAATLLERAYHLAQTGPVNEGFLEAGIRLASVRQDQGKAAEAEAMLQRLLSASQAAAAHYFTARLHNNLGYEIMRESRHDAALPHLQEALKAARQAGAQSSEAAIQINLAMCHSRLGEMERAKDEFRGVIASLRAIGDTLGELDAEGELANTYVLNGEPAAAIPYYEHAIQLAKQAGHAEEGGRWMGNLALALRECRRWDESERWNREAERAKRSLGDNTSTLYTLLNAAAIDAGRKEWPSAKARYESLLGSSVQDPALVWEAEAGLAEVEAALGHTPEADTHYQRALSLIEQHRSALAQDNHRITFLARLLRTHQSYVDFLVEQKQFARALAVAEHSKAQTLHETTGAAWKPMQVAARSNATALAYWLAPERSFLWIVTGTRISCKVLPSSDQLGWWAKAHQNALRQNGRIVSTPAGKKLFDLLLLPVADSVPKETRLLLSPDGVLHGINFETLPLPDGRYAIERYNIAVTPSLMLSTQQSAKPAQASALLMGDPLPTEGFPRLQHAGQELAQLQQSLRGMATRSYRGEQAQPGAYRDARPAGFRYVHFAAHASANPQDPLESAIILSPGEKGSRLYARDILQQPLAAELVTLSACRSAGARTFTGEGQVGLAWAFLKAGARSVVASTWDVDDASTAQLMGHMYTALAKGEKPAEALRKAKLSLLHGGGAHAKPNYWAAFQLYTRSLPTR